MQNDCETRQRKRRTRYPTEGSGVAYRHGQADHTNEASCYDGLRSSGSDRNNVGRGSQERRSPSLPHRLPGIHVHLPSTSPLKLSGCPSPHSGQRGHPGGVLTATGISFPSSSAATRQDDGRSGNCDRMGISVEPAGRAKAVHIPYLSFQRTRAEPTKTVMGQEAGQMNAHRPHGWRASELKRSSEPTRTSSSASGDEEGHGALKASVRAGNVKRGATQNPIPALRTPPAISPCTLSEPSTPLPSSFYHRERFTPLSGPPAVDVRYDEYKATRLVVGTASAGLIRRLPLSYRSQKDALPRPPTQRDQRPAFQRQRDKGMLELKAHKTNSPNYLHPFSHGDAIDLPLNVNAKHTLNDDDRTIKRVESLPASRHPSTPSISSSGCPQSGNVTALALEFQRIAFAQSLTASTPHCYESTPHWPAQRHTQLKAARLLNMVGTKKETTSPVSPHNVEEIATRRTLAMRNGQQSGIPRPKSPPASRQTNSPQIRSSGNGVRLANTLTSGKVAGKATSVPVATEARDEENATIKSRPKFAFRKAFQKRQQVNSADHTGTAVYGGVAKRDDPAMPLATGIDQVLGATKAPETPKKQPASRTRSISSPLSRRVPLGDQPSTSQALRTRSGQQGARHEGSQITAAYSRDAMPAKQASCTERFQQLGYLPAETNLSSRKELTSRSSFGNGSVTSGELYSQHLPKTCISHAVSGNTQNISPAIPVFREARLSDAGINERELAGQIAQHRFEQARNGGLLSPIDFSKTHRLSRNIKVQAMRSSARNFERALIEDDEEGGTKKECTDTPSSYCSTVGRRTSMTSTVVTPNTPVYALATKRKSVERDNIKISQDGFRVSVRSVDRAQGLDVDCAASSSNHAEIDTRLQFMQEPANGFKPGSVPSSSTLNKVHPDNVAVTSSSRGPVESRPKARSERSATWDATRQAHQRIVCRKRDTMLSSLTTSMAVPPLDSSDLAADEDCMVTRNSSESFFDMYGNSSPVCTEEKLLSSFGRRQDPHHEEEVLQSSSEDKNETGSSDGSSAGESVYSIRSARRLELASPKANATSLLTRSNVNTSPAQVAACAGHKGDDMPSSCTTSRSSRSAHSANVPSRCLHVDADESSVRIETDGHCQASEIFVDWSATLCRFGLGRATEDLLNSSNQQSIKGSVRITAEDFERLGRAWVKSQKWSEDTTISNDDRSNIRCHARGRGSSDAMDDLDRVALDRHRRNIVSDTSPDTAKLYQGSTVASLSMPDSVRNDTGHAQRYTQRTLVLGESLQSPGLGQSGGLAVCPSTDEERIRAEESDSTQLRISGRALSLAKRRVSTSLHRTPQMRRLQSTSRPLVPYHRSTIVGERALTQPNALQLQVTVPGKDCCNSTASPRQNGRTTHRCGKSEICDRSRCSHNASHLRSHFSETTLDPSSSSPASCPVNSAGLSIDSLYEQWPSQHST